MRDETEPAGPRRARADLVWVFALTAFAAVLRFWRLGLRDFWLDESMSYYFASARVGDLVDMLRLDSGPPLYYVLLRYWSALFGDSEVALRSLSAACGAALVAAVYLVGRRLIGGRVGLYAAVALTFTPIHIYYSREARAYAVLSLLVLLATYLLWRWIAGRRPLDLVGYAVCLAAALYVHNYAFLVVPAHALLVGLSASPRRWPWAGAAMAGAGLVYLPWVRVLVEQMRNEAPVAWMRSVWARNGFFGSLFASLQSLSPGGAQPSYVDLRPTGATAMVAVGAAACLLLLATWRLHRAWRRSSASRAGVLAIVLLAFVPPVSAALLSLLWDPIYLPGRLDQLIVPAFCLLLACGVESLGDVRLRALALCLFVALPLPMLGAYYRSATPVGERALGAKLEEEMLPGDALIAASLTRAPLEYYLRARRDAFHWYSFPVDVARHPGNVDADALAGSREELAKEAAGIVDDVVARAGETGRAFLVLVPDGVSDLPVGAFQSRHPSWQGLPVGEYRLSRLGLRVWVYRFERAPEPAAPTDELDASGSR